MPWSDDGCLIRVENIFKLNQATKYFLSTYYVHGYMQVPESCHLLQVMAKEKVMRNLESLERVKLST